jgi:hypothetical protein
MTRTRVSRALAAAVLTWHGDAAHATADRAVPPSSTIATATAHTFRVDVMAERSGSGSAPSATVYVTAYSRDANGWQPRGRLRLGVRDGFFWHVLTGPHAVRDFTISDDSPDRGSVELLVSPALGWSQKYHVQLAHGALVR